MSVLPPPLVRLHRMNQKRFGSAANSGSTHVWMGISGSDCNGDGIPDACDPESCAYLGDFDHDEDVDQDDYEVFRDCSSGPTIPHGDREICREADFDHDEDVDQSDFGVFQSCLSGPSIRPDPACVVNG